MRLLTTVPDEQDAKTLSDALYAKGVQATIKATRDGGFAVWVHDEERMEEARTFLGGFNPKDARIADMARHARTQRRQEAKQDRELQERTEKIRRRIEASQQMRIGNVTMALMAISVVMFLLTSFGEKTEIVRLFTFTPMEVVGNRVIPTGGLMATLQEPCRLITPMFLHFGFLHIAFNMWWLKDLGTAIERVFSPWYLLVMVLVMGVFSHLLEYEMSGPTIFGGMSGVVYGLFAFIWIRGRFDPSFPYRIPPQLVTFMMIWLGLGFTGWIGPIANWVHSGGLIVGAVWGYVSAVVSRGRGS